MVRQVAKAVLVMCHAGICVIEQSSFENQPIHQYTSLEKNRKIPDQLLHSFPSFTSEDLENLAGT